MEKKNPFAEKNKNKKQNKTHHQRWVPWVDQSIVIQLPSAEDGVGFLRNVWFKIVNVVEQF